MMNVKDAVIQLIDGFTGGLTETAMHTSARIRETN
jgi:hypothetical protein